MFCCSEFSRLRSVTERDFRVIRGRKSDKDFVRRRKRRGIGRLDKTTEGDGGIIGPEGRNSFIVLCPFCEVDTGGVSLTGFEVSLGSVGTLPLGVNRKRAGRGTISEHDLWLTPIDMGVMFSEPSVAKDNVVVSEVRDIEGDNFMVFVGAHGKENLVGDFAVDVSSIIGISYDKRGTKFLGFHVIFFNEFPVDETGIGTTIDEGMFLDAALPLL